MNDPRNRSLIQLFQPTLPTLAAAVLLLAAAKLPALPVPPCTWTPGYALSGDLLGDVTALAVHNDGTGAALYAAGTFYTTDGTLSRHVAKWDGSAWSVLDGPAGTGLSTFSPDFRVDAMVSWNAALYVGGSFQDAGGVLVNHVAKWDGNAWSALAGPSGTGTDAPVRALAAWNGALYAAGEFQTAGGVLVNHVAKWNGNAWSALNAPLGKGVNAAARALAVFNDGGGNALYVGGLFTSAGGTAANRVAKWNGTSFSALGSGANQDVLALRVFSGALYAGGRFTTAGGVTVNHVAKWNGSAWSALAGPAGTGTDSDVEAFVVWNDGGGNDLYLGGLFTSAGGVAVPSLARWNGTAFSAVASGSVIEGVSALAVFDDGGGTDLYVGGRPYTDAGYGIARWDGSTLTSLAGRGGVGPNRPLTALLGSSGQLYAGAASPFLADGMASANALAAWDGSAWSALGNTALAVQALAFFNGKLHVGGTFNGTGVLVTRWNGSALVALSGAPTNNSVEALMVWNDGGGADLYAGGVFDTAGGVTVNHVARWNGSAWTALGTGLDNNGGKSPSALAFAVFNGSLYVAGNFDLAGGLAANSIARWNGTAWSVLASGGGTGLRRRNGSAGTVEALVVFDDGGGNDLYAAGNFDEAGGIDASGLARWNGSAWSAVPGGPDGTITALAVFDDGRGDALYATGDFDLTGGAVTVNDVARWDGTSWTALSAPAGAGLDDDLDTASALVSVDDGFGSALYVGGSFESAGGQVSSHLARWGCGLDFGDAASPLPTLAAQDGAYHWIVPGSFLGAAIDADNDGQPGNGDDTDGQDDEDGVVMSGSFLPGSNLDLTVTASRNGRLDAWVDWNGDGDWNDAGEEVFYRERLTKGANALVLTIPATVQGNVWSRFRFSGGGGTSPTGEASDGEVEDYLLSIDPPLFADGFESGDTTAWSSTVGG